MFTDKNRAKRFQNEARAIERKARRHGGMLSGRDAARLAQVKGRVVKFSAQEQDEYDGREYN